MVAFHTIIKCFAIAYLFMREREINLLVSGSPGLGKAKPGSRNTNWVSQLARRAQGLKPSYVASPSTLVRSLIGSGTVNTQIGIYVGA